MVEANKIEETKDAAKPVVVIKSTYRLRAKGYELKKGGKMKK